MARQSQIRKSSEGKNYIFQAEGMHGANEDVRTFFNSQPRKAALEFARAFAAISDTTNTGWRSNVFPEHPRHFDRQRLGLSAAGTSQDHAISRRFVSLPLTGVLP